MKIQQNHTHSCVSAYQANYRKNYQPNFKAKYFHSEFLQNIVDFAVENNLFKPLNQSRKNIEKLYLTARLRVELGQAKDGTPYMTISKYKPRRNVLIARELKDYTLRKICAYPLHPQDTLKSACEKLIKLGENVPRNKMFNNLIVKNTNYITQLTSKA